MYSYIVLLHILGATVWTGGHLVLATVILPSAIREHSVRALLQFESAFEKIGIPSLIVQVLTGFWLAKIRKPDIGSWLDMSDPDARLILLKISLLILTAGLAIDARFRLIPDLTEDKLKSLAFHIIPVTLISVCFVIAGVSFRGVVWF